MKRETILCYGLSVHSAFQYTLLEPVHQADKTAFQDPKTIHAHQYIQRKDVEMDDQLMVGLDPFNLDRNGYFLQVNPNGIYYEALIGSTPAGWNADWEMIWEADA